MTGPNATDTNDSTAVKGKLRDGWTYSIERIPKTDRFRATVLHPYSDDASSSTSWSIEDNSFEADPSHPTYPNVEEAISGAESYIERLRGLKGYPNPDKMSARGFRPALW